MVYRVAFYGCGIGHYQPFGDWHLRGSRRNGGSSQCGSWFGQYYGSADCQTVDLALESLESWFVWLDYQRSDVVAGFGFCAGFYGTGIYPGSLGIDLIRTYIGGFELATQESIKLIALDLDGTSVDKSGVMGSRLINAVAQAQKAGIRVILATGRMVSSARVYWKQLELGAGPLIAYNGGVISDMPGGRPLSRHPLPDGAARELVVQALEAGLLVQVYVGDELWVNREDDRVRRYVDTNHIPAWVRNSDELLRWPDPPIKLLLQSDSETLDRFRIQVEPHAAEMGVRVFKSQADYLEMVVDGVGKGPALAEVCQMLDIGRESVMAVGDAENDVDMLKWAGFGVAMGQAPDAVKQAARVVTEPIDQEGAARAIERYALATSG